MKATYDSRFVPEECALTEDTCSPSNSASTFYSCHLVSSLTKMIIIFYMYIQALMHGAWQSIGPIVSYTSECMDRLGTLQAATHFIQIIRTSQPVSQILFFEFNWDGALKEMMIRTQIAFKFCNALLRIPSIFPWSCFQVANIARTRWIPWWSEWGACTRDCINENQ